MGKLNISCCPVKAPFRFFQAITVSKCLGKTYRRSARILFGYVEILKERMSVMTDIINETRNAVLELIDGAKLKKGDIVIIGCSSSEISGGMIGKISSPEIGKAVFETIHTELSKIGVYAAAQCCEHLNRAIIIEREAARFHYEVNVVPQPKAGGSLATAAYETLSDPVAIERIQADAGIDIGNTLIGMHLKPVAVPLRINQKKIGCANVVCARTRAKFIGGERAHYNQDLL